MEFEARLTGFATGIFLLASYIMLFDLWDYSGFLMALASLLLLLVAFKDHSPERRDFIALFLAMTISVFFLKYLGNNTYLPLVVLLIVSMLAINGKIEIFIPSLAGLITLLFLDPGILSGGLTAVFAYLSPLFHINYAVSDTGYLILYHTRTHLPILIDDVKILLPFYVSIAVAGLALLAMLKLDHKTYIMSVTAIVAIPFLFLILNLQNLLNNPSTSTFILDNLSALVLPLTSVLLMCVALPGTAIRKIQPGGFGSRRISLAFLMAFFLLAIVYCTPYEDASDPVIIIDESHSEWEPTWADYLSTLAKDPVSGANNYFGLMNIISRLYDITLIIDSPLKKPAIGSVQSVLTKKITQKILENITSGRKAVLVIKCVTSPYSQPEIDAIMNFTAEGNGLILIGEHTDIYGMSTNINPISELMGYRFLSTGVQDVYTDTRGSITQKGEFPPLMARYMTGDLLWETSTSLEKLSSARPLFEIITRPSYFAHYRNETSAFFLNREFSEEVMQNSLFARHRVVAGTNYGKGRAILFTDSTDFNNGVIGIGDHLQIFMAMVEYVSGNDMFDRTLLLLPVLSLALAIIILNRRNAFTALVILSLVFLIAFNLSYPLAHYTTTFPELKSDSRIALVVSDENYLQDYLSGMYDLDKLMDRYFRQNLTALVMPDPPKEWVRISARADNLQYAIADRKAAPSP